MQRLSVEEALAELADLAERAPARVLVGIAGPPGAGKSTLARRLADGIPGSVLVPMDGFHLAHGTLTTLGSVERKGAPDTFDAAGYLALLRRLREAGPETVWAPEFRREIEDAVAGAIGVPARCRVVLTEGNYLLLQEPPWDGVRGLLDRCWYVDVADGVRQARLTARHMAFGRDAAAARQRTLGSDERNARLVAATRERADALVALE